MKRIRNAKGFTLLEIIIVTIILGTLATLALPRLLKTVEFSRSIEALSMLREIRWAFERCAMMGGTKMDYTPCDSWNTLAVEDPNTLPSGHFTYDPPDPTTGDMTATRNTFDGGDGFSTITFSLDTTTGILTKSGTGIFSGIR